MGEFEKLKLDYTITVDQIKLFTEIRFKLIALVPVIIGITIGSLSQIDTPNILIFSSIIGAILTFSLMGYDQRNSEMYEMMLTRAIMLESKMFFYSIDPEIKQFGGAFFNRPSRGRKFLGVFSMWHDRSIALIYSSAFTVMVYFICKAIGNILNNSSILMSVSLNVLIPLISFLIVSINLHKLDKPPKDTLKFIEYIKSL